MPKLAGYSFLGGASHELQQAPKNVDIKIIAFNDLHGNLHPPKLSISAPAGNGATTVAVPAGGVAYMAGAIKHLKSVNPNHAVVSAGDMIGASPLVSALFLDEPTIEVVNEIRIDFNAVGNHEFDKGNHVANISHRLIVVSFSDPQKSACRNLF